MIRAWRNEALCLAVIVLVLLILGILAGKVELAFAAGGLGYLLWHIANFFLLQRWIAQRRHFRLPKSLGIWEAVFDGLQRDQIRKRRRRRRLIRSLADYREAATRLPDALVILSERATVRWFNASAKRLLGLRWPDDLEKSILTLLKHPALEDDLAKGYSSQPLELASPVNGAWMINIQVTAPFGNRHERLLVGRDVTQSFHLEEARRGFLASVSHELRTPITVFYGYLEAIRHAALSEDELGTALANMDQQVQRMQALVDDLLTLSRLEMADRRPSATPVPVAQMLQEIVTAARALSDRGQHDLHLEADPRIWLLGAEADLHSAFSNLIFNAVRHTPPGTRIEISWRGTEEGARFSVRDKGPGIAAHHLPRLTERFYRVDSGRSRPPGGTGLGLTIVKQVLDRYTADLTIHSVVGEGSTFACHFPKSCVAADTKPAPDVDADPKNGDETTETARRNMTETFTRHDKTITIQGQSAGEILRHLIIVQLAWVP